jgi:hypothetical protein
VPGLHSNVSAKVQKLHLPQLMRLIPMLVKLVILPTQMQMLVDTTNLHSQAKEDRVRFNTFDFDSFDLFFQYKQF